MGIQGLLPQLKSIMAPIGVEDLRGQTVAVDTYSWLHKGALSCALHLCKGLPTTRHIEYCMHRVNLLRHHGVKPILIFDGGLLPMKIEQENKRSRSRKENLERAMEHEATGNAKAAFECYQKAVDISPSIALQLIQVLKQEKVDYIVAPYEADAQMAFLSINKLVDAVITEDSDLIPFGCSRIIFKMDKFGQGVEFHSSILEKNKDLDFTGFTKQMLLEMCIFSGCDYLQSLPGMGVKRAHSLVKRLKSYEKVIKHLRYSAVSVSPLYEENFKKAIWAFQHQRVYDPSNKDIVHLSDLSPGFSGDLEFLGPWLPQAVAKGIAEGNIDPLTKMPFEVNESLGGSVIDRSEKASFPAVGRKKLDLPVQKNILTNYFCIASLEAKRKFRAPKVLPKELLSMDSSSPIYKSDNSEPSSQEATYANKHIRLPSSNNLSGSLPEQCPRSTMEINNGMSFHNRNFNMTDSNVDTASAEAQLKIRTPKVVPKKILIMDLSSASTATTDSESPPSEEYKLNSALNSGEFCELVSELPLRNAIEMDDEIAICSKSFSILPLNSASESLQSSLLEMKDKMLKPILASHKEQGCNSFANVDQTIMKSRNRKVMVRSSYFKQKAADEDELEDQNVEPNIIKNSGCRSAGDSLPPEGEYLPSMKKRKSMDVCDQQLGAHTSKDARTSSLHNIEGNQFDNLNDKEARTEAQGKFGCNISHLTSYTGIAEKSLDSFAAIISSFRYGSSGSRASGLRAPLKRAHNIRK